MRQCSFQPACQTDPCQWWCTRVRCARKVGNSTENCTLHYASNIMVCSNSMLVLATLYSAITAGCIVCTVFCNKVCNSRVQQLFVPVVWVLLVGSVEEVGTWHGC